MTSPRNYNCYKDYYTDRRSAVVIVVEVDAVARVVYLGGTLLWLSVMRDEQTPVWGPYLAATSISSSHTPQLH